MAKLTRGLHDIIERDSELYNVSNDITPVTAGSTLTNKENAAIYSNEGATAIVAFILPTAVAGYKFRFIVSDADGIRVTAAAGDTIRDGATVSAVAGKIESTAIGSAIELISINATEWFVTSKVGTWAVT